MEYKTNTIFVFTNCTNYKLTLKNPGMYNFIKLSIQKLIGFESYLFNFSKFSNLRMRLFADYEREFKYFLTLIPEQENCNVLDIGANIGITTVPLAQRVKQGTVYSFEPVPQNYKALEKIVKHYQLSNVVLINEAIGDYDGEISMVIPVVDNVKMQGLSHVVQSKNDGEGNLFSVPIKKLDNVVALHSLDKISAIKIDVENFELEVLTGAVDLLGKHKPVIYAELWENEKRYAVIDLLQQKFQYKVMIYDDNKLVPYTNQKALNFFFIP